MTLRFTDDEQLERLSPKLRQQVQAALHETRARPGRLERLQRPEQAAGKALVAHLDALEIEAPWDAGERICVGDYFAHNANGGARTATEGAIFKGQGVRAGWPDYTLYLAIGRYHGLVLELKAEQGATPDDEQLDILARLEAAGWCAAVAWGGDDAIRAVERYLDLR